MKLSSSLNPFSPNRARGRREVSKAYESAIGKLSPAVKTGVLWQRQLAMETVYRNLQSDMFNIFAAQPASRVRHGIIDTFNHDRLEDLEACRQTGDVGRFRDVLRNMRTEFEKCA
jgi:hypothetical protein